MDEEEMSSDETTPSSRSTRESSDSRGDSLGHFVMHLAGTKREDSEKGNSISVSSNSENDCHDNMPMFSDAQYCYSLLEAMPMPGPVWSTTEPCVLAEPPPLVPPPEAPIIEGSVDLEWGENQASSYSWWLGFLETLDGNVKSEKMKCPFIEMEDSKVFSYESPFVDAIDQTCCLDDWLMIPTMEMDLEDMVMP